MKPTRTAAGGGIGVAILVLAAASLPIAGESAVAAAGEVKSFYTVAEYDPDRDPNADLAATIIRATEEDKRILLVVGGDWCVWCKVLEGFIDANESVAAMLAESYLVMKVDFADDGRNGEFLAAYPNAAGYPHFYVLAKDGTLLHSQNTALLEEGESYSLDAFTAFLAEWRAADRAELGH